MSDAVFRDEVIRLAGDEIRTCIQCGTCSSSCSTAHLMDNSIRKLIRLVLEGRKKEALASESIWLCTSCLLCTVRCPRGIRPKAVVSALRNICEREGIGSRDASFERIFIDQIRKTGRISEVLLSAAYALRNPDAAVPIMEMGIELLSRGKVSLDPGMVKGMDEIERIFREFENE
ncbi:MAG: 4Fe-4S dicluster domain-containing protein [Candidatus Methanosuratincola petrocarbonis]